MSCLIFFGVNFLKNRKSWEFIFINLKYVLPKKIIKKWIKMIYQTPKTHKLILIIWWQVGQSSNLHIVAEYRKIDLLLYFLSFMLTDKVASKSNIVFLWIVSYFEFGNCRKFKYHANSFLPWIVSVVKTL